MKWFIGAENVHITPQSIEDALKSHFNCILEPAGDAVRVRHEMTTDEEWAAEKKPPTLTVEMKRILFDEAEEWFACIWSVEDESGDAHQYLAGAALDSNMIAAAMYFAT